jgi:hypothetical protein
MIRETSLSEWSLREEILHTTHRWPVIVVSCLLGSLLGLVIAYCLPSPHRATKELYVGINVYKATEDRNASEHAGLEFSNPDDYKNWQMANLNSLIFMDPVIRETLARLKDLDPYWLDIDQNKLSGMLHSYWRNAGKWRLVADNANPRYAFQAVLTWEDVVVDKVHNAISESQKIMVLDSQMDSLTLTQAEAISRTAEITQIRESLISWRADAIQQDPKLPVKEIDREFIAFLIKKAIPEDVVQEVITSIPSSKAPLEDFIKWLDTEFPLLDEQLLISQRQIATLEGKKDEIASIYAESSRKSLGLSPNLQVDKITTAQPTRTIVRPTGLLVLVGGILGLIAWTILWLTQISQQTRK